MINFSNVGQNTPARSSNPDEIVTIRNRAGNQLAVYRLGDNEGGSAIEFVCLTVAELNLAGWRRDGDLDAMVRVAVALERLVRIVDNTPMSNDGRSLAEAVSEIVAATAPEQEVFLRRRRTYPNPPPSAREAEATTDELVQRTP